MSKVFRGAGRFYGAIKNVFKCFRASLSVFRAISILTGSFQYFRGILKTYGHDIIVYGDVLIIPGEQKFVYKFWGTYINLRGIFPHMDRHTYLMFNFGSYLIFHFILWLIIQKCRGIWGYNGCDKPCCSLQTGKAAP